MVAIDLKALTEQAISEMGYNSHDLWLVKIGSVVYGPYETESLKHYVGDNEQLFETAEASRADETEWKPFWSHTKFQRRKPQVLQGLSADGPFWIMDMGLKVGPLSFRDIDKKIEFGLLGITDHVSLDNGNSWVKLYEISGFDRRSHAPEELPLAPMDSSFQKARLQVVEKLDAPHASTTDELADMCWSANQQGKVIQFKIEEMTLQHVKSSELAPSMKWVVPTAIAACFALVTTGYFMFRTNDDALVTNSEEASATKEKSNPVQARGAVPDASRLPASTGYSQSMPSFSEGSRYPTQMVTHEEYSQPQYEADPVETPLNEVVDQPQEQSLVNNTTGDDGTLDQAMTPGAEAQQPVIEEASDF